MALLEIYSATIYFFEELSNDVKSVKYQISYDNDIVSVSLICLVSSDEIITVWEALESYLNSRFGNLVFDKKVRLNCLKATIAIA